MDQVFIIALTGAALVLFIVLELVRRQLLGEGHSLLWLVTGFSLILLALWPKLLRVLADLLGIHYPPAALFVIGFGFVLLLLLQFSITIHRLSQQNKNLVQHLAILQWKLERLERSNVPLNPESEREARGWPDGN